MNFLSTPEFKVGFFVLLVGGLVGLMSIKVGENPSFLTGRSRHHFYVPDAGGLVKNSAVKMAGIKIGTIEDIVLEGNRAKVILHLDGHVKMKPSTRVELRSDGILGDRHVELVPGKEEDPILKSGEELTNADGSGGLNSVMAEVARISKSINELTENLNAAAKGKGDPSTPIGRIVLNLEKITADLAAVTDRNKEKFGDIIDRIENISRNVDAYINEGSLSNVEQSIRNIEQITAKINKGEGTLGRLVNDEQTVEELNQAIANVNQFLGGADKLETSIDFHSEVLADANLTKSYLGLRIQPGLDRYYEIQVIDDPLGVKRSTRSVSSLNGAPNNVQETTTTFKNSLKFTGLFAKNFYNFTIKGGIIENSGGFGMDYYLLDRNLRVSAEFFDFDDLYIRTFLRYTFFKGLYLVAGGDNLLSAGETGANAFIGAGLFLTNDDLKLLASKFAF